MSNINVFIIKTNSDDYDFEKTAKKLLDFALKNNFALLFNSKGNFSELLRKLNVHQNYFCVIDSLTFPEAENVFELPVEKDFENAFNKKFEFLNKVIDIIFEDSTVISVEFLLSQSYTEVLEDFKLVNLNNKNLTESLFNEIKIIQHKISYIGLPNARFIINRKQ